MLLLRTCMQTRTVSAMFFAYISRELVVELVMVTCKCSSGVKLLPWELGVMGSCLCFVTLTTYLLANQSTNNCTKGKMTRAINRLEALRKNILRHLWRSRKKINVKLPGIYTSNFLQRPSHSLLDLKVARVY